MFVFFCFFYRVLLRPPFVCRRPRSFPRCVTPPPSSAHFDRPPHLHIGSLPTLASWWVPGLRAVWAAATPPGQQVVRARLWIFPVSANRPIVIGCARRPRSLAIFGQRCRFSLVAPGWFIGWQLFFARLSRFYCRLFCNPRLRRIFLVRDGTPLADRFFFVWVAVFFSFAASSISALVTVISLSLGCGPPSRIFSFFSQCMCVCVCEILWSHRRTAIVHVTVSSYLERGDGGGGVGHQGAGGSRTKSVLSVC